ncbi:MAG TPA: L-rhamnose mutarotase [Planctomycetes bacterium]|nr:L-rhamnose mutarotase [Planctomycetota bacterium]
MKRIAYTIDLQDDPQLIEEYCTYHRNVWPEVQAGLKQVGLLCFRRQSGAWPAALNVDDDHGELGHDGEPQRF